MYTSFGSFAEAVIGRDFSTIYIYIYIYIIAGSIQMIRNGMNDQFSDENEVGYK